MTKSARPLAIIQLQTPPDAVRQQIGEQHHWFMQALQLSPAEFRVYRPDLGEALPEPGSISAAILSGSWAMVTDHEEWSERTAAWVRSAMDQQLPLLGVCYGHQLMAYALGGKVGDNPNGWERGLQQVSACSEQNDLAMPAQFQAWLSHRQSVLVPPQGAEVLAGSVLDRCQVIRYSPEALSVQFHPEFTAPIMRACLPADQDAAALAPEDQQASWPLTLLQQFWQDAQQKELSACSA